MFTAQDIFEIAIRLENNGEKAYREAMAHTSNEALKSLLDWMAREERNHARYFSTLKAQSEKGEDHHLMAELSQALVEDVVKGQAFSLQEVDFSTIDTPEKMIRIFIAFEEDTLAFYEVLKALITEPGVVVQLERIIAEERNHVAQLQKRRSAYLIDTTVP